MSYDVHFFDKNNEPITEQWVFTSRTFKGIASAMAQQWG
jgi:hypothetical protein